MSEFFISSNGNTVFKIDPNSNLIFKVTIERNTTATGQIIDAEASIKISKGDTRDIQRIMATNIRCDIGRFVDHVIKLIGSGQSELTNQLKEVFV